MIPGRIVRLRPVERSDLALLQELMNDPVVTSSVVGWGFPVSMHGQERWLESSSTSQEAVRLMVDDAETGMRVGSTGLWDIDWHNRSAFTGVKLHPEHFSRGMGSDSIMTLMAWALNVVGLHRLHGAILDFNVASKHTYVDRCGWQVEGVDREAIFRKGGWIDLHRVAALRSDFDALPNAQEYVNRICPVDVSRKWSTSD